MEKTVIICSCICIASCVFVLLGCVYITITVQELRDVHSKCKCAESDTSVNKNKERDQEVAEWSNDFRLQEHANTLQYRSKRMVPNYLEEIKKRPKRKTKDKKKKKKRFGNINLTTPVHETGRVKILTSRTKENRAGIVKTVEPDHTAGTPQSKTKAGHYITFAHSDEYVKANVNGYDDSTEGTIHVFKPSTWVSKKMEPFSLKSNGEFQAKQNGIYFVYAQVLFHDNKYMQAITMQHTEAKTGQKAPILSCYISGGNPNQQEVYNTCSMQGLVSLKKKDILTIENDMHDVKLHMRKATTYFGAFVLK